jgi:2-desacetyl-2-hydroxyethyl bacteriochlorophyllide A dehydrogenase
MTSPGTIEHREVDEPRVGSGQVLLRIQRIGVCGSDVHVNHGTHPFTGYPVIQGHEFSAVVEAVGDDVTGVAVGSKVTAMPQETCGACPPCRRGDHHICDRLKVRGFQAPGVALDLFVTEAASVVPLPENFTFEQGAFVEPVAVAAHATARAGGLRDRNVVVLGAGPIGNLVAQMCRCHGARVLITDVSDYRLDVARRCGIDATSNATTEPLADAGSIAFGDAGFDLAFDCAGVEATISAAIDAINKGGTIVVVAVFENKPPVDLAVLGDRELTMTGTLMYQRPDYEEAIRRIATGDIVTQPLESKHFPLEQFADAYEFIEHEGERCLKVFIDL